MAELAITEGTGLRLTLDNGITIALHVGTEPSDTVVLTVWDAKGHWLTFESGHEVHALVTDSLRFIELLRSLPHRLTASKIERAAQGFEWTHADGGAA